MQFQPQLKKGESEYEGEERRRGKWERNRVLLFMKVKLLRETFMKVKVNVKGDT